MTQVCIPINSFTTNNSNGKDLDPIARGVFLQRFYPDSPNSRLLKNIKALTEYLEAHANGINSRRSITFSGCGLLK